MTVTHAKKILIKNNKIYCNFIDLQHILDKLKQKKDYYVKLKKTQAEILNDIELIEACLQLQNKIMGR